MLKVALLILGLLSFIGLIWHVGPLRIVDAVAGVGPVAVLVMLLPSVFMYLVDAYGWRLTLGPYAGLVSFGRLFAIRTAGEVVNMTTPTAYVGGEPLKAYLLNRHGVPLVKGLASVVTAKTTMTLAEVAFILMGVVIGFWVVNPGGGMEGDRPQMLAAIVSIGLLGFATAVFMAVQRRGLFTSLLGLARRCRIRIAFLEDREATLRALDRTIFEFYRGARGAFLLSMGAFVLGWLAEALEVYTILSFLSPPADLLTSIAIGALAVLIKGSTFFIPGSLGAQEGGNLLLVMAYGYSDLTGMAFAVFRRIRELVWIVIGLVCLAAISGFRAVPDASVSDDSAGV